MGIRLTRYPKYLTLNKLGMKPFVLNSEGIHIRIQIHAYRIQNRIPVCYYSRIRIQGNFATNLIGHKQKK